MSKLVAMTELSKKMELGKLVPYRDMQAKVEAFSDEHVFLSIPEIAVNPEDVESLADGVRIRDREVENLKRECQQLRGEIDRLIHDPYYLDRRRERERYDRKMMDRMYMEMPKYMDRDFLKPLSDTPIAAPYFDPLSFKRPSQQK